MLPTWPNDTPFRKKDCRESIFAFGLRTAHAMGGRVVPPLFSPYERVVADLLIEENDPAYHTC